MNSAHALRIFSCVIFFLTLSSKGATVTATYNFPTDVPITASSYSATGNTINFTLNCVPSANVLTVVKNTGPAFIQGTFSNLAQGQAVALSFNSITYNFVANYYGGSGRDIVLVRSGARAFAAGANTNGQLGDNTKTQRTTPIAVSTLGAGVLFGKTVVGAAAGELHSLALCSDGTLAAWGFNYDGELGTNNITQALVPVAVNTTAGLSSLAGKTVVAVAAGELHSLALCSDGTVSAWGHNYEGELGNNSTGDSLVPVAVNTTAGVSALAGKTVTAIAAGALHNLALCADGTVAAWGYNYDGELGNNSATDSLVPVAVDMSGVLAGKTVVAVAAGNSHSLALCSDGTVAAWGDNTSGQLGTNNTINSRVPVAVNTAAGVSALAGKTVVAITAGAYHNLALCADGILVAWGSNGNGQLGDNTTVQRLAPVTVNTAIGVSALSGRAAVRIQGGQYHSVAQCSDGAVVTWGWNGNGQLGDNSTVQRNIPVVAMTAGLGAGERFVYATTGATASHTLALAASVPPAVPLIAVEQPADTSLSNGGLVDFGSLVVGNPVPLTFTIRNKGTAALTGLTITIDGANSGDFLVTTSPPSPVAPGSTATFTVLFNPFAGGPRTGALHLACNDAANSPFNLNLTGNAATTGAVSAVFNTPTDIPIVASNYAAAGNIISITLNCVPLANELIVVRNTGPAFIQGYFINLAHGQAVALSYGGQTYTFVANYYGGSGNDLVLVWEGTRVVGFGSNLYGPIGDGTTTSHSNPVNTVGTGALSGKTVLSVSVGDFSSIALCSDGTVLGWGYNAGGQLGDNSTEPRLVPTPVNTTQGISALYGKTVVATEAGNYHCLALCSDGAVAAWGGNGSYGVLGIGNNTTARSLVPVSVSATSGVSALFGKTVTAVSAGSAHSLALCSDGTVVSWGRGDSGQLGNSTYTSGVPCAVNTAAGISALHGKTVVKVSAGSSFSLALCSDGTVVAWGAGGALGNNNTTNSFVPVAVNVDAGVSALAGKTVVDIAAGYTHSLALCSDGTVAGWGDNGYGQLGINNETDQLVPVLVNSTPGMSALAGKIVTSVKGGALRSFAVCSDGTLVGCGWNSNGGLGNGSVSIKVLLPVATSRSSLTGEERFTSVATGQDTSIALVASTVRPMAPICAATGVTNLTQTSVNLNGSVNPRGFNTTAFVEYGTNGTSFPNSVDVTPGALNATQDVALSTQVIGLTKGTPYYYRLRASNQGGVTVSAVQSFITRTEPTAILAGVTAATTTSLLLSGSLNAHGSDTQVFFDYGTDGVNFPTSVAATPLLAVGYADTPVSAGINNLMQSTTYYYRIRGTSLGGVGVSAIGSFQLAALSGLTQVFPSAPPAAQGFLFVNLEPSNLPGTGWRFVGEQQWRVPGVPVGGLATGNREIEFRPVAGFLHPLREPVSVTSGAAATVVEREYFQGGGAATASLSVTLLPTSLGAAAQWRLLGEGDAAWRASGASLGGLAAGVYLVECKDVAGYTTPRPLSVTIGIGEAKTATVTYFLADAAVGTQPGVVGFDAVTSATANPFTYVGQLRSDSGAGTGFVVRQRVVATAAHVVFDDGTLSAATGLQWLFQRERGTYEPVPQIPRGSYILSGYSAQRIADATPGTSSVAAQNLDVASVWFYEQDAGRGGSGGYLASDSTDNEWLISPRLKTIVGYPLDGISAANQGRIHATPPINATFGHANARVYLTDNITSRGGNSGGPVCVQYDDGRYFPAAIYLGGTTQTRVRAIDSDVITLFDSAEESSTTGENSTNGGSTQTNNSLGSTPSGTLTVTIEPQAAHTAGAGWRIGSGAFLTSGQSKPYLSAGNYTVTFKSIEGFQTPSSRSVSITGDNTTPIISTYIFTQPSITSVTNRNGVKDVSFIHQITTDIPVTTFGLSGTLPGGLTFDSALGRISGTPTASGDFTLTINVANAYGGTDTGSLRIKIPPKITNTTTLASLTQSQGFSFQTTTPGDNNVSYAAPGLPDGMTLDGNGLISGIPTISGSFEVDVSATNAGGTTTHHLTINVAPQTIGEATARGLTGQVFSKYKVTVKPGDIVTGYSLSGNLPDGLFFLADSGEIVGTPTEGGIFPVTVSATNAGGTSSQLVTISINPVLAFAKVGNGTVSPLLAPATEQTPGATVMLTAQAAEGSFFAGWTGDVPSSERVLNFAMDGNRSVQANFRTFAAMKASYSGLVQKQQPTYSDTGLMTLTLTAKGSFSGKLQLAGASYKVSGVFGSDGKYSGSVSRGKVLSALPLELHLGVAGVTGEITLDSTAIPFLLTPPAFNSKTNKAPQAGSYTFTFPHPADTAQPQGDGYATVTVSASGVVALAGALGDGSVISVGGNLTSDGEWAVFATPYGGKGLFAGTLAFHDDTIDFVDGAVFWSKPEIMKAKKYPGAFTADIAVLGSRWTPPARNTAALDITDWNLAIGNGVLTQPLTATTTLNTVNIFTLTGATGTKLTLAPKTGILTGSFPGANGKPVKFNGALLQSQRIGRGVFALPDKTDPVTLDPPP